MTAGEDAREDLRDKIPEPSAVNCAGSGVLRDTESPKAGRIDISGGFIS